MTLVDGGIAHALANKVGAERVATQAILTQDVPATLDVAIVLQGPVHLEMIAPAGEFQAVIAEGLGLFRQHLKGQVRPLAGK